MERDIEVCLKGSGSRVRSLDDVCLFKRVGVGREENPDMWLR